MQERSFLLTPIQYLKGIGPYLASHFEKLGLKTVEDLLYHLPARYLDRRHIVSFKDLEPGKDRVTEGEVLLAGETVLGRSQKKIFEAIFSDGSSQLHAKWFRYTLRFLKPQFVRGKRAILVGNVEVFRGTKQMIHPEIEWLEDEETAAPPGIVPVYPLTEGLSQKKMQDAVCRALEKAAEEITETLPDDLLTRHRLLDLPRALLAIHKPDPSSKPEELNERRSMAHRRLIFEEFFLFELACALKKQKVSHETTLPIVSDTNLICDFTKTLPFSLTESQKQAIFEIETDLKKQHPMNRLLHGDVGSGKTVVAAAACLLAAKAGFQTAMMAPTEILAEQHFQNLSNLLKPFGILVGLLKSEMAPAEKRAVLRDIESGLIAVLVGTHALIQTEVRFKQLNFAIVDEQHRFGVKQRAILSDKGKAPHRLVMTATPIPRTLAMTVYGDLDVSVLREKPAGRQPVLTRVVWQKDRPKMHAFVSEQIKNGRQAYVVCPLVTESENLDLKNATETHAWLEREIFPDFTVGLLHGQLKAEEKKRVVQAFLKGTVQILVSTTVVEVGIDVPNATILCIEHPERFGLAQLHQLRGRVGRGSEKSYCFLLADGRQSEAAQKRLEVICKTDDGFKIAEADLDLRGPGEFLGTRQSGLPDFRIAHLLRDADLLYAARDEAFDWLRNDPNLLNQSSKQIKLNLVRRFYERFQWSKIG